MKAGLFRADLLHRLHGRSGLRLAPLEKRENVFGRVVDEMLVDRGHQARPLIAASTRDALRFHKWTGNLRELGGVLDEAVAVAGGDTVRVEHLPSAIQQSYLSKPLHVRATGFLLDELDGQTLTKDLADWRAARVAESFAQETPPAPNEHAQVMAQFLALFDDKSEAHQAAIKDADTLVRCSQELLKLGLDVEAWKWIAAQVEHQPLVSSAISQQMAANLEAQERCRQLVDTTRKSGSVDQNPWLRLAEELKALPLLKNVESVSVVRVLAGGIALLQSISPEALNELRKVVSEKGLPGIRAAVGEVLMEMLASLDSSTKPVVEVEEETSSKNAKALTRAEWLALATLPTQAMATEKTGYDPKTIRAYFAKFGIQNPWSKGKVSA